MAQKLSFASGGSSSWADEDDLDSPPLPFAAALTKVEEQEPPRAASPRREQSDRKYSNDSYDRDHGRGRRDHGGYADRGDRSDRGGRGDRGGYRGDRGDDRGDRGGYHNDRPKNPVPDQGPYRVFMGNLSFRVTEQDIVDFMGTSEAVTDVRVQRDPETDRPRGFAYVEFRDREALVQALTLDGENFDGRQVRIDVATEKPKKTSGSFFEKRGDRGDRGDRSRYDRRGAEPRSEGPRERPRLSLQPRSAPAQPKDGEAQRKSIFGEAKPRDEAAFLERKKAQEAERAKAKVDRAKEKAEQAKASSESKAAEQVKKNGPREPRERKASHDAADTRAASGRGGGRGRGERVERTGGRGRGGGGQAPASERTPPKKDEAKPKASAVEPKPKAASAIEPKMPKAVKLPAPATTKTKNAFELLNADDSDSD